MKKLLFVDHSYHAKTGATKFLRDLLASRFNVETLWDEAWSGGTALTTAALNARRADAILFFQVLPKPRVLRGLQCANLTWAPMRDGLRYHSSQLKRLRASPIKILNFCREAHDFFSASGQESLAAQYWPPPAQVTGNERALPRIFFWPRRSEITWDTLKTLLGDFRPDGIVLRYAADPGHDLPMPTANEIRDYGITVVQGWLPHATYLSHLGKCDIFVAPRPLEGIGQAMLEAMSLGLAVIAPDAPTMNEYLRNGHSGWLYPPRKPAPLDFSGWVGRGAAAHAAVVKGHASWLSQADAVCDFVAKPSVRAARWDWRVRGALRL